MTCLDAAYDGIVRVPAIHLVDSAHYYEIGMDPDPKPECELVTRRWRELLDGEDSFCVYVAPLQEYEGKLPDSSAKDGSVWIINQLKSAKGYWKFEDPENWPRDDELSADDP